jgi:uncharacterized protein
VSATENKKLMRRALEHLAEGDAGPFVEMMADDFTWTTKGRTPWSRTYEGRDNVRNQLHIPLISQFNGDYRCKAERFIAEDDWVVVQCSGAATTKRGGTYENEYIWMCRFDDGRLVELIEYLDTDMVVQALDPPGAG